MTNPDCRETVRPDTKDKARGFYQLMTTHQFQCSLAFLQDLLHHLSLTSKRLQATNVGIADVSESIEDLSDAVDRLKTVDGSKLQRVRQQQASGHHVFVDRRDRGSQTFDEVRRDVLSVLSQSLSDRYEDVTNSILLAMRIVNFSLWPDKHSEEWATFGDEQMSDIVTEYKVVLEEAEIDTDAAVAEWPAVRAEVGRRYHNIASASWKELNVTQQRFPNALGVVDFVLSLPSHSADCERGFSLMKRIKNDWRSSLANKTLNDLMRISLQCPERDQFDPAEALQHWATSGQRSRRPQTQPYGQRKLDAEDSSTESDESVDSD